MVQDIEIRDFDYPLPDERIARHPLAERDRCLLLHCGREGEIADRRFDALPGLLPAGSLMVCNNTRVINARMRFVKDTGAAIEVFLLEPIEPSDYALMFQSSGKCRWSCMIGNLKRWKQGSLSRKVEIPGHGEVTLSVTRLSPLPGNAHEVELTWDNPAVTLAEIVEAAGKIPIPPYLNRQSEESDATDYQTVYSRIMGSVAAPTAGLHFTDSVLGALEEQGIERAELTLHVGAGTFQPVKSDEIGGHEMHTEVYGIRRGTLQQLIDAIRSGRHITAVGTTSVRTLESLPYAGMRLIRGEDPHVTQWEPYAAERNSFDTATALQGIADYMDARGLKVFSSSTAIMIAPGFGWRMTDAMVTNFHQPQSTLLLLVSSFLGKDSDGGERWRRIYRHALEGDYRFLSYGDACLFFRP